MILTILAVLAAIVQIFFGFLFYVERSRPTKSWPLLKQTGAAGVLVLLFTGFCAWRAKDKVFVDKQDLQDLREIADGANQKQDYDAAVKVATWALRYEPDYEEMYRIRARAYKRKGPDFYRDEISDRQIVLRLNPTRELNHLPIIEDYILLKEYQSARAWIKEHKGSLRDQDETIMFEFFDLSCDIAEGRDYASRMREFQTSIQHQPLSKKFVERTWEWDYLETFFKQNPFSESKKAAIKNTIQLMKTTAR
jgi:tetratricopeptide (TPR) repeat protein